MGVWFLAATQVELELHNNMTWDDGLTFTGSWKPLLCLLRDSRWSPQWWWLAYGLLGAITSISLPHAVTAVSNPKLCCTVALLADIFPPGPRQLSSPLFLVSTFNISYSPPLTSTSTVVFSLSFPFLYYLPIFSPLLLSTPFFVSCYFIPVPFLPFLYHSNTSPPIPLHLGLVQTLQPPLNFSITELFIVMISFLFHFFPCPSVHIMFHLSPDSAHSTFTME